MNIVHLQDRLYWGLNRAANILGGVTEAYRTTEVADPLAKPNRFLKLRAAFSRADGNFDRAVGYNAPTWLGFFDASYTRVGDYLVQNEDVWFIVEQQPLLPVLCAQANRTISITRQVMASTGSAIGATNTSMTIDVISRWPASTLGVGTEGKSPTHLPGETTIASWTVLVPSVHGAIIQPTDIVTDDLGINGIVIAAELSRLGWRLNVHQVTT
jgi:hypothetical protein